MLDHGETGHLPPERLRLETCTGESRPEGWADGGAALWADGLHRLGAAIRLTFRSRWRYLTWLTAVVLFVSIIVLTGALERFPPQVRYPLPPGTVRVSTSGRYVVVVVTPHVVLNLVFRHLARAAFLAVLYGATVTLAAARRRGACPCRPLAVSGIGAVLGTLGLAFCCGPLLAFLIGLGLTRAFIDALWVASAGLGVVTFLILAMGMDPGPERRYGDGPGGTPSRSQERICPARSSSAAARCAGVSSTSAGT